MSGSFQPTVEPFVSLLLGTGLRLGTLSTEVLEDSYEMRHADRFWDRNQGSRWYKGDKMNAKNTAGTTPMTMDLGFARQAVDMLKFAHGDVTKKAIADNKLDSEPKYEAYRKAHPELRLPDHMFVRQMQTAFGWEW